MAGLGQNKWYKYQTANNDFWSNEKITSNGNKTIFSMTAIGHPYNMLAYTLVAGLLLVKSVKLIFFCCSFLLKVFVLGHQTIVMEKNAIIKQSYSVEDQGPAERYQKSIWTTFSINILTYPKLQQLAASSQFYQTLTCWPQIIPCMKAPPIQVKGSWRLMKEEGGGTSSPDKEVHLVLASTRKAGLAARLSITVIIFNYTVML